jgi:sugar (pentulose or hexulose) kinase
MVGQDPERWWQAVRTTVQRVSHQFDDIGAIKASA